jgi:hypothetical protein
MATLHFNQPVASTHPNLAEGNTIEESSSSIASPPINPDWSNAKKVAFRIAFIFFVIMSIPSGGEWYKNLFHLDWAHLHYRDLYDVARFQPGYVRFKNPAYNLLGYADWVFIFLVAVVGAAIWSVFDRKRKEYNILYYWLRVIVRYRAGIGIIGFGFTKLMPTQMPYPSLALLHTNFGDFTAQKIYWLSIGIAPWYQVFGGVVELTAGFLLFFRKTTTLGAVMLMGALGDITYVNFAYDGGVHVYASYFVIFAFFLIADDVPHLYNLLILERWTTPIHYYPKFKENWQRYGRIVLKVATIVIFMGVLFYVQLINFWYDPYKQPAMKGVTQLRGYYDVTEFKVNNKEIPYSPLDSVRWQDVTFENWSTLTFKVNKPVKLDLSNGGGAPMRDINRTFEITGTAGGRRAFYYDVDTSKHILFLQDKNVAGSRKPRNADGKPAAETKKVSVKTVFDLLWKREFTSANIPDENTRIGARGLSTRRTKGIPEEQKEKVKRNRMILKYSTIDGNHIVLTGVTDKRDSLYIVLDKSNRKPLLTESKLQAGKY